MTSLSAVLPAPKSRWDSNSDQENEHIIIKPKSHIPKYGQRSGWQPKSQRDFGDGGAYPEIHIAQFPLDMGKSKMNSSGASLALQVDSEGNVRYDALARQGHSNDRIIQSQYKDIVPLNQRTDIRTLSLDRPSEEEVQETADKTRLALESITQKKIKAAQPKNVKTETNRTQFFRFTPNSSDGTAGQQRIIKMVDVQQDPMEPPKFKAKKIPRGPPSPPAPVLHSPPRKVTAKEQEEWMIPPCVSNWKNPKGYTIPLDKRLASDGRGLADVQISDKFAKVTEALSLADRYAREEIRQRSIMQQKLAEKEKQTKEETLRQLAQKAREERAGTKRGRAHSESTEGDSQSDEEQAREREDLRRERRKEREREQRLSRMGSEQRAKVLAREQNRDISEKIMLGLAKPTTSKESMYDARLFNRNEGMSSTYEDE